MLTPLFAASALIVSLQAQPATEGNAAEAETQVSEATATENDAAPAPEAEVATEENRVICRRTQVIGSKFTKRICGTQAEWDELARKGQISTAEFQAKGAGIRQASN